MLGPHGAPDFLTAEGLAELLDGELDGPPPLRSHRHPPGRAAAARGRAADGGEAGLHPSNILDSAYGVGTVMLAGDMAVIVGPDGPSLGGFVAVAQVIRADLLAARTAARGRQRRLDAVAARRAQSGMHAVGLAGSAARSFASLRRRPAAMRSIAHATEARPADLPARRRSAPCSSSSASPTLDLRSRVRAHALREALDAERVPGVRRRHPRRALAAHPATTPTR